MKTVKMLKGSFQCGDTHIVKGATGEVDDHTALDLVKRGKAALVKNVPIKPVAPATS